MVRESTDYVCVMAVMMPYARAHVAKWREIEDTVLEANRR